MDRGLLIAGVPRSGKSTLARRIRAEADVTRIALDAVVSAFGRVFPDLGIRHHHDHDHACAAFLPFLADWLRHTAYEGESFVADLYHLRPEDARGLTDRADVIFLGYPDGDPEKLARRIRKDERLGDWTSRCDDEELGGLLQRWVEESRALRDACARLGLRFVDVSKKREAALDAVFEELVV